MTLIISLANCDQVIQVSDRRTSNNGIPLEDESNKAAIICCADARFAIGYTGLASTKDKRFETKDWLFDTFGHCLSPNYSIYDSIERLKIKASNTFQSLPSLKALSGRDKRLSIIFSGYHSDIPPRANITILTNFHDVLSDRYYEEAWDDFKAFYYTETRPIDFEFYSVKVIGNDNALTLSNLDDLKQMLETHKPAEAIVGKTVEILRKAADSPKARKTIGKQISSITIPRDQTLPPLAKYHSDNVKPESFMPTMILARNEQEFKVWKEPKISLYEDDKQRILSVPKVGRNYPCPCGSGKKYKRCHGRKDY